MRNLFTLALASFVLAVAAPYGMADDEVIISDSENAATVETSVPAEGRIYAVSSDCTCEAEPVSYATESCDTCAVEVQSDEGTNPIEWGVVPK